jgi:hypothetical protein
MDSVAVDTVAKTPKGMVAVVSIEHQCGPIDDFPSPGSPAAGSPLL